VKLELKGFQQIATDDLLVHLRAARAEADRFPQAVLLSAPTGAGKTVIATAVIEGLMDGDEMVAGSEQTTVLWLTDQPELNEQTKRKMKAHSSLFDDDTHLVTIESGFQERVLWPGKVYFLNTQKLATHSGLMKPRDERPWTLWDTVRETIAARSRDFVVIIDEAHRGMDESARERQQAQSIVQRFIKGADNVPPAPIIFGISATPDRFRNMVAGRRTLRPQVEVLADVVRGSGLLKQTLLVYHPRQKTPSDFTLLRAAAERHREYSAAWEEYRRRSQSGETVAPILVIQVGNAPEGRRTGVTETDLAMALSVVEAQIGPLDEAAMGHAFQEGTSVPVGDGRILRHVAPSDIQEDAALRVVFFKTALTTGWDCPRAEVMMSFRRAVDHTTIAQLVGRMVRTPLARTIEDDEFLNTVSLFLPHYDKAGLDKVLNRLQQDDPEFLPPVEVRRGAERARLHRDPAKADCFAALARLQTYDVQRVRATTSLRRVVKLARLLDRDSITVGGLDRIHAEIVAVLEAAKTRLEPTESWRSIVKDSGTIDLRKVEWALGVGPVSEQGAVVEVTQQNVEDLFAAAGRRLGEGLHKTYWRARAEAGDGQDVLRRVAKLEIFALSQDPITQQELEALAEDRIAALQADHGAEAEALAPNLKEGYRQVRLTARDPEPRRLEVFEHIEGRSVGAEWADHIYVDDDGLFHYDFRSSWEPRVLGDAMSEVGFVGWLRIEDRKDWALTIPYRDSREEKPLYPDLLTFRRKRGKVVVDLLDPHDPGRDDWFPKVRGLAVYASKHWTLFGRIEASFIEKDVVQRLDLCVERNRNAALATDGPHGLRALFRPR
jgi:type III restriction enzyme